MSDKVRINWRGPAVELRIYEQGDGDFPGMKIMRPTTRTFALTPGENEVDATLWSEWKQQNAGGLLLEQAEEVKDGDEVKRGEDAVPSAIG